MKSILNHLFEHKVLSREQAKQVLVSIAGEEYNSAQVAAFLTVYLMRSITVEELEGFREALLELCLRVDLSEFETIDMCGTGGDGKDTFNISTLASFVVAGCGIKVAKHGNYGVSSACGSSNVLEHLGFRFTADNDKLKRQLEAANICFLHAPLFHPAMRSVAPVRKELGVKTFFNMLGPLVNPAFPKYQSVGVFSLELARLYRYLLQQAGKDFVVLHSVDGYDEVSLTSEVRLMYSKSEQVVSPAQLGFRSLLPHELHGGVTVADSAKIFLDVLKNKGTAAQSAVVKANAAVALRCGSPWLSTEESTALAAESLESGKAFQSFEKLISI